MPYRSSLNIFGTKRAGVSSCILLFLLMCSCANRIIQKNLDNLRHTWKTDSLTHTTVYYQPGSFAESKRNFLHRSIEERRADILRMMGESDYPARVDVFFFSTKQEMNEQLRTNGEGKAFPQYKVAGYIYSPDFDKYTRHELAHVISINLWSRSASWIQEGFATLTDEDRQTKDFHDQSAAIWGTDNFIPIEKIFKRFDDYDGNWYRYVEAASLLRFIREKYGFAALKEVWHNKRASFEGHGQNEIVEEWISMIKNRAAK